MQHPQQRMRAHRNVVLVIRVAWPEGLDRNVDSAQSTVQRALPADIGGPVLEFGRMQLQNCKKRHQQANRRLLFGAAT